MHKKIAAILVSAAWATYAHAMENFVVKDIRVEGIQRTEAGTVFSYLPVKVGDLFDADKSGQAMRALYATGFFKDIELERDGNVLVVAVQERPAIDQIDIHGSKEFTKEQITDGLKQAGLSTGKIFDQSMLDRATQEIKRLYYSHAFYSVVINTTVTPLARNRVSINFDIQEGKAAKIEQVNFVGNNAFSEKKLRAAIVLGTPNWLSWYSKNDQYSSEKLAADLETLRAYYLNRGYLEFNIDSSQVSISPDKQNIYVNINMTEGPIYKVTDVKLGGELLVPEAELRKLIDIQPGDVFSRQKITDASKKIGDRLGNDGYAFANVNAVPEIDKDKHTVAFTFMVDPGHRVYVNHINFTGNKITRDEVARREFRQLEGSWYDAALIQRSRERLQRLGYFSDVNVETPAVPDTNDQVDVNVSVTELPTGSIMAGVGFASQEGLILSGSISQNNVFGSGNALSLNVSTGLFSQVYSLSYTNPYSTADGLSSGYDLYRNVTDTTQLYTLAPYYQAVNGVGGRLAIPLNEKDTLSLGVAFEFGSINVTQQSPLQYTQFVAQDGNNYTNVKLNLGWAHDTRDSLIYPTSGMLERLYGEIGTPLGSLNYYKINYQQQWFAPLSKTFTLMLNGQAGIGGGYNGQNLPFFDNFYAGGVDSVRGYDISTLGPKYLDPIYGGYVATGGDERFLGSAELMFPMPGMEDKHTVRLSTFVDAGTVFGPAGSGPVGGPNYILGGGNSLSAEPFRFSTGVALNWISPMGPLKFSLAQPLNPQPYDQIAKFQFTMGQVF
jgi:outer membrane protein insertion porin family